MTKRHNHYEAAFEAYLRREQTPYIAVDEAKRSLYGGDSLKSLDFIVTSSLGMSLLVDVKGRRFPTAGEYWKNWTTQEDLDALQKWHMLLGIHTRPVVMFAYWLVGEKSPLPPRDLFSFRARWYAFIAVDANDYRSHANAISAKWQTVSVAKSEFQQIARPFRDFLHPDRVACRDSEPVSAAT